jgi:hypothetical protein
MNDFIYIEDKVFSPEFCSEAILFFDALSSSGFGHTRKNYAPRYEKDDITIFPTATDIIVRMEASREITSTFNKILWDNVYKNFTDKFDILSALDSHGIHQIRMQKTLVGGGYHIWHCETASRDTAVRLLTFTVYLNTVDEGGETEFLYYPKRVKAETGRALMFPAGFTHTHRGNPPISNDKYIITGWIEF